MLRTTLAALTAYGLMRRAPAHAAGPELRLAPNVPEEKFDFGATGIDGWTTITGQWAVETIAGAPTGRKVLVQRAVKNWFNAIIAPPGPYTDVEASVKFLTISGREDASCGIVFRYDDGKCYAVRANALEDSFSLYAFERGRRQLASATVSKPPLGQWHLLRVARSEIGSRPGSTAPFCWTIATRAFAAAASGCGRESTRSRRSTSSRSAA